MDGWLLSAHIHRLKNDPYPLPHVHQLTSACRERDLQYFTINANESKHPKTAKNTLMGKRDTFCILLISGHCCHFFSVLSEDFAAEFGVHVAGNT